MRFGSLFAGIGGFDLGFERAGMVPAWFSEVDRNCNQVLAHHWPDVPNLGRVEDVGRNAPAVDVVCGGFPCQDLSVAGKREGLSGERSGLWFEFRRVLAELRPRWAVIENVPGLLSSNGGRDFATLLQGLANLGYGVCWRVLDAQYLGVAQRRRRVFIVGSLGSGRCAEVLFEREGGCWDSPPRRETGEGVAGSIGMCSASGGFRQDLDNNGAYIATPAVAQVQWASGGGQVENDTSRALRAGAEHNYQFARVGMDVRRLTPRECERLQGFPDDWTAVDGMSDSARYRMLGNAVAVPVAEWLGCRIMEVEHGPS